MRFFNRALAFTLAISITSQACFADGLLPQKEAEPVSAQISVQASSVISEDQASEMISIDRMPIPLC
jgi:hypothetical protein